MSIGSYVQETVEITATISEAVMCPFVWMEAFAYERIPACVDRVLSALTRVSFDQATFADAAINLTAEGKWKMYVGATSEEPPTDDYDDLFCDYKPWNMYVELGELEETFNRLAVEVEAKATTFKEARGVMIEHLSKV